MGIDYTALIIKRNEICDALKRNPPVKHKKKNTLKVLSLKQRLLKATSIKEIQLLMVKMGGRAI